MNAFFNKVPREKGRAYAQYQIPGKLTLMLQGDGKVIIRLNILVKANDKMKAQKIKFALEPETKWKTDRVFLPTKIVKRVGGNSREWNC